MDGGIGAEVGLDGGVNFIPSEIISAVFVDNDLDVRVETSHQFAGVSFDVVTKVDREVLLEHGPDEHECRHYRTQIAQRHLHVLRCHRIPRGYVMLCYVISLFGCPEREKKIGVC